MLKQASWEGDLAHPALDRRAKKQRERRALILASALTAVGILLTLVMGLRLASDAGAMSTTSTPADAPSIAVLPFEPIAADRQNASFGIGLADSIINHLSNLHGLTVRPMSAVMKVTAGVADPVEAGRLLGVNAIMSGSFERTEDRFKVTVRLIDIPTGAAISKRTFDSRLDDLIGMERTVVTSTLGILAPRLRFEEPESPPARSGPNSTAHYLYLLARGKLSMYQSASVSDAVELLEQSIKADPEYAPAHALLAVACSTMFYSGLTSDYSWLERAIASARRAIALDEKDPSAHHALGHALMGAGEPVESARQALLALKLDPNHPRALRLLATLLSGAGLQDQVRQLRARIFSIDPSIDLNWIDTYLAFMDGNPAGAIARFEAEVDRRQAAGESIETPVIQLGYLAFMTGDSASALRWAAMMESVSSNRPYNDMIRMLALSRTGDTTAVRTILAKSRQGFENDWEYCEWIGMALALVHENDEAIEWIERSVRLGSYDLELLDNSQELDPLRADPRFETALSVVRGRARQIIQLAAFAGYR